MKNNKDIMCVYERYNKKGELSFELHCSGKDPYRKKYKVYIKTYKVPLNLTGKKEIEKFRLQCQLEWKQEVESKSKGLLSYQNNNICFCDYAEKWVEDIIRYNEEAYSYYSRSKGMLPILRERFGLLTLQEMTLPIIQNFCDWLCERTYKKEVVIVKRDIREAIKDQHLTFRQVFKGCEFGNSTLCNVLQVGKHIKKETANKVCKFLGISFNKYFDIVSEDVPYSKSANKHLKTMVHSVLARAVREGLIPTNYASKEYTKPVTGTVGKKVIFESMDEIQEFLNAISKEEDIRKRTAFYLSLNLGVRGAELAGFEWKDIDFGNQTISILRNTLYVDGFGIVTKTTKTKSSKRTIQMPSNLIGILKEYKVWWDKQKILHGDLWANTDRLFVQNCGKNMSNSTIAIWLKKFEKDNNLKRVTLHGLRHTNITMQIVNGVDIKTVSARVGHSDIQTTLNIYSHYTKESDKRASEIIDDILSNK